VSPGRILLRTDLEAIPLVNPGDPVRLEVVDGDLAITLDAVARSGGAAGDKIRLEMPTSRKVIQGVVTGPGEARARWAK
jgi:flagella basal body P-ring formation protein FlgA